MDKRIIAGISAAVLCLCGGSMVYADADLPRLVDDASLLDENQQEELTLKLDEIYERQEFDVVIVTVDSLGDKTATEYADDYFDYNGYGYGEDKDGILFLVSMEDRDWAISTHGYGIPAFTDAGQEYIMDQVKPLLSSGDYGEAFDTFAQDCDEFLTQAYTGEPYDVSNLPKDPFSIWFSLLVAVVAGVIVAAIITTVMWCKLNSVHPNDDASSYIRKGSMKVDLKRDIFLYRTVTKTEKPKNESGGSSTHTSSSGETHGGSSGKF